MTPRREAVRLASGQVVDDGYAINGTSPDRRSGTVREGDVVRMRLGNSGGHEIAFVADDPGIWMDHCRDLTHAAEGLVAQLMYEGVTAPRVVGGDGGNAPE